jgi:hypothetical protein
MLMPAMPRRTPPWRPSPRSPPSGRSTPRARTRECCTDTLRRIAPVLLARAFQARARRPTTPGSVPRTLARTIPGDRPSPGPL